MHEINRLKLDPDVQVLLLRATVRTSRPAEEVINDALRLGLKIAESATTCRHRRQRPPQPM